MTTQSIVDRDTNFYFGEAQRLLDEVRRASPDEEDALIDLRNKALDAAQSLDAYRAALRTHAATLDSAVTQAPWGAARGLLYRRIAQ